MVLVLDVDGRVEDISYFIYFLSRQLVHLDVLYKKKY